MINKLRILLLALLPILITGCLPPMYNPISMSNLASQNLYMNFDCLVSDAERYGYLRKIFPFGSTIIEIDELIFNSCYTISFYQKRGDSYCFVRKYDIGEFWRAEKAKKDNSGTIVIRADGYEFIPGREYSWEKRMNEYNRLPKNNDLCDKNSESIPIIETGR